MRKNHGQCSLQVKVDPLLRRLRAWDMTSCFVPAQLGIYDETVSCGYFRLLSEPCHVAPKPVGSTVSSLCIHNVTQ